MAYLIDTDISSPFLRGLHGVGDRFRQADPADLVISRITWSELMVLAVRKRTGKITRRSVEQFIDTLVFMEVDEAAWSLFPEVKATLLSNGTPVGDFDILQACLGTTRGLTMVTHNQKHYAPIAEVVPLRLEDWAEEAESGTSGPR